MDMLRTRQCYYLLQSIFSRPFFLNVVQQTVHFHLYLIRGNQIRVRDRIGPVARCASGSCHLVQRSRQQIQLVGGGKVNRDVLLFIIIHPVSLFLEKFCVELKRRNSSTIAGLGTHLDFVYTS